MLQLLAQTTRAFVRTASLSSQRNCSTLFCIISCWSATVVSVMLPWWKITSNGPSFARASPPPPPSSVRTSPVKFRRLDQWACRKLSAATTSWPSALRCLARLEPMNPAPPVTRRRTRLAFQLNFDKEGPEGPRIAGGDDPVVDRREAAGKMWTKCRSCRLFVISQVNESTSVRHCPVFPRRRGEVADASNILARKHLLPLRQSNAAIGPFRWQYLGTGLAPIPATRPLRCAARPPTVSVA